MLILDIEGGRMREFTARAEETIELLSLNLKVIE